MVIVPVVSAVVGTDPMTVLVLGEQIEVADDLGKRLVDGGIAKAVAPRGKRVSGSPETKA